MLLFGNSLIKSYLKIFKLQIKKMIHPIFKMNKFKILNTNFYMILKNN